MLANTTLFRGAPFAAFLFFLLTATGAHAQLGVQIQAIAGEPFGVGRISLDPGQAPPELEAVEGFRFYERTGRIHYPAFGREPVRGILRNVLNLQTGASGFFLFTGSEPLEIVVPDSRLRQPLVIRPQHNDRRHRELLNDWWRQYSERGLLRGLLEEDQTPPQVKNYLANMLAVRLGLPAPRERDGLFAQSDLDDALGLMLGAEALRLSMQRKTLLSNGGPIAKADLPLPPAFVLPASPVPVVPGDVAIEPLAAHVPQDCFYLRCGSYANFLWMRNFLSQAGGDLKTLITHRGIAYDVNARMERQLVIKSSALSDLLGGFVISDVAFIGSDAFMRDGPSIGLLFEARNSGLLANNIRSQRQALLAQEPRAKEEQLEIAGRQVSFLSTPENDVRSFHAIDGDYHLVTTSRVLVERFFAAGKGERSLAALPEFRHARTQLPLSRQDTLFLFLPTPFLAQLTSPHYRVEMNRRLQASGDIELFYLAQLAARGEGRPAESIEQLVAGGFLPPQFGRRSDGSQIVLVDGVAHDSLRGGRGSFIPIPDVAVAGVTPEEVDDYRRLAEYSQAKVQRLDPVVVGIQRSVLPDGVNERVAIDARFTPFGDNQLLFLATWLAGPADRKRLAPMPGDLVAGEVNLAGQHLFTGLRDCNPLRGLVDARRDPAGALLQTLASLPLDDLLGYVGATSARSLSFLGNPQFGPADAQGYARSNGPLWRREYGDYVVLSFHRSVLEAVTPLLQFEEAARPATARLRVADLRASQLAELLNSWGARSAEDTTLGNARLLNSLVQQVHVPPAESLAAIEKVLDARLVCALEGEYALAGDDRPESAYWSTTALGAPRPGGQNGAGAARPATRQAYQFPAFNWFRGLESDFLLDGQMVWAHLEIDMAPLNGKPNGNGAAPAPRPAPNNKRPEELPPPKPQKP